MPLSVEELRDHLAYSAWASQRLVQAASELTEDELIRDFQTADHSVLGTLVHTFAADRVWLDPPAKSSAAILHSGRLPPRRLTE